MVRLFGVVIVLSFWDVRNCIRFGVCLVLIVVIFNGLLICDLIWFLVSLFMFRNSSGYSSGFSSRVSVSV